MMAKTVSRLYHQFILKGNLTTENMYFKNSSNSYNRDPPIYPVSFLYGGTQPWRLGTIYIKVIDSKRNFYVIVFKG